MSGGSCHPPPRGVFATILYNPSSLCPCLWRASGSLAQVMAGLPAVIRRADESVPELVESEVVAFSSVVLRRSCERMDGAANMITPDQGSNTASLYKPIQRRERGRRVDQQARQTYRCVLADSAKHPLGLQGDCETPLAAALSA